MPSKKEPLAHHQPGPGQTIRAKRLQGGYREFDAQNFHFRPAAYGLAIKGRRLLLGRSHFSGRWDVPGGAVEPWEQLTEGLCREFCEETGVRPEPLELYHFDDSFFSIYGNPYHSLRFYYRVTVPDHCSFSPQPGEMTAIEWVDLDQWDDDQFAPEQLPLLQRFVSEYGS